MKIFGYSDPRTSIEAAPELVEVTLNATPSELRCMAEFFVFCATEMERMGQTYDHLHLSDRMREFRESPHFVVMRNSDDAL